MTFLPIVTRELRVASRRRGTYWSRSLTAVIAIITGGLIYMNSFTEAPAAVAQTIFYIVSFVAMIYCLSTGIIWAADCLSEEKRDGTLGLLFLTDLKGYDVVGGKLVATSLNAFYGLTAIFPVLAIPLLMGGITNAEFWRMTLVLANTFLFSLAVGMFMSSISKSPRWAMAGTLIAVLAFTIGLWMAEEFIPFFYRSPSVMRVSHLLNPGTAYGLVQEAVYLKQAKDFWWCCGVVHGFCWLFLALASVIVPRSWQDRTPGAKMRQARDGWHKWSYGDTPERLAFRRRLLDINAFYWHAGRVRIKPVHVWFVLAGISALWIWGAWEQGSSWNNDIVYILTAFAVNSILKIWVTSEAGRRLGEDRKMGALELILSTPLSVPDILRGQMLALRRQFLWPLIAVIMVEFVFLVASLRGNHSGGPESGPVYVALWMSLILMLVADILALCPMAMWTSLTAKNPNRTTGMVARRVLVLPDVAWVLIVILTYFFRFNLAGTNDPSWKFMLSLWVGLGILADLYFGLASWSRLHKEFRTVAAHRFAQPKSFLQRWFGKGEAVSPALPAPSSAEAA